MSTLRNTIILTVITLVAGVMLGAVYEVTKEPIAVRAEDMKKAAYQSVLPEAESFEGTGQGGGVSEAADAEVTEIIKGYDAAKSEVGWVCLVTTHEGYGGDITLAVGIGADKKVRGIEILDISETPGLGMRSKEPGFLEQFGGLTAEDFSTDGKPSADVDAISGATITTNAVMGAVYVALESVK